MLRHTRIGSDVVKLVSSTSGYGNGTTLSLAKDQVVMLDDAAVQQDLELNAM